MYSKYGIMKSDEVFFETSVFIRVDRAFSVSTVCACVVIIILLQPRDNFDFLLLCIYLIIYATDVRRRAKGF